MRVLFVEDEEDWLDEVSTELFSLDSSVCVVPARSSASAVALIEDEGEEFDLIICDLRIPPSDGGLAIDENQGLFVQARAREIRPGVPCMVLTGYATAKNIRASLSLGEKKDIFGTREQFPMVVQFSKEELPEAIAWVKRLCSASARTQWHSRSSRSEDSASRPRRTRPADLRPAARRVSRPHPAARRRAVWSRNL